MRVCVPVTGLHRAPDNPVLERQVLYGHPVRLLDPDTGFARDETSGYVGYIRPDALGNWVEPTHQVAARSTFLFSAPDIKQENPLLVSIGAKIAADDAGKFLRTHDGRYAVPHHLEPVTRTQSDLAKTARKLLGTPYLWGGNSAFGIDCSGLVQMAVQMAGQPCQGDSDQQMRTLGTDCSDGFHRNDLLFWKGHVGLMYDADTLIHANAHHMMVAMEPINDALERIETSTGPLLAHKRLTGLGV